MKDKHRIVTVGFSPAWDVRCRAGGLDWGMHAKLDDQVVRAAGKALNVSRALAWMRRESIAAGLWGRVDYEQMLDAVAGLADQVQVRMSRAEGHTRQNITVVDTRRRREMHLRAKSELASSASLDKLQADLRRVVGEGDICVFSGAMPTGRLLEPALAAVRACRDMGARLAIDTHGEPLKALVDEGLAWLIAPNSEELGELLGANVPDTSARLAAAGRGLLEKIEIALISRGNKGAMVVARDGAWTAQCVGKGKALETVGCGDYLLAGFLAAMADARPVATALEQALKVATAHAWGWTDSKTWRQAKGRIGVKTAPLRA